MTNPTSDSGTVFKTLPGGWSWKVHATRVTDLQEDVQSHRIVGVGNTDHRLTATTPNRERTAIHTTPLNGTSAEAARKKRFP